MSDNLTPEERGYEMAQRLRPRTFQHRYDLFSGLDEHFTHVWLNYTGRNFLRNQLDVRTRVLLLTAQYTVTGNTEALADTIQAGIDEGLDLKQLLEIMLQCYIYAGESTISSAAEVFVDVVAKAGKLEQVKERSLPADATSSGRSLDEERQNWSKEDSQDPRLLALLEHHDWKGISTGLRLRPGHHLDQAYTLDSIDPEFLDLWLGATYQGMYARTVIDDRTRLLCVVGACLAMGETRQARNHMRGALKNGATPKELMEVVFQSCAVFGHPRFMALADDVVLMSDEVGRIRELVDEARVEAVRRIVLGRR